MCRRVDCPRCGRPSFAGCGAHVEQVLRDVPRDRRCHCHDKKHDRKPDAKATAPEPSGASWLGKLFGK